MRRCSPYSSGRYGELIDRYSIIPQVQRIILFGSSVTTHCNVWSDVDLYVELSEDVRLSKRGFDFDCDLWTTYTVDDSLREEILRTGVIVYEKEGEQSPSVRRDFLLCRHASKRLKFSF